MISFACKPISLEDVFTCSFGISKQAYRLLMEIAKYKEVTVKELARKTRKDRTTIQKLLRELLEKNLVVRRQVNLDKGGYRYYYSIRNKEELKRKIKMLIHEWTRSAELLIDKW
ncbi:MarR family transcriptional regulator [Candidatus Woesearchaeota archaeon]|nr:MarR family transcriptional regulator [Candidatus Woesearchaeota archaeon]